jgi:DnaK suppressor protein
MKVPEARMGMTELQRYKQMLEDKYEDLRWAIRKREAIAVERSADVIDELQSAVERERAITELDRYSRMLQQVKAALSRIQEGTFGSCLRCDEPISPARLKAVPWAAFCIRCQEAVDAEGGPDGAPVLDDFLRAA